MDNHVAAWLEVQKNELVGVAEKLVCETRLEAPASEGDEQEDPAARRGGPQDAKPEPPAVTPSQIRNLLAAAQNGSPLAILTNFLRYQHGRRKNGWNHKQSFEALQEVFTNDLPERCKKISIALSIEQRLDAEARIAAQFLGFLSREYTYRRQVYEENWRLAQPASSRSQR